MCVTGASGRVVCVLRVCSSVLRRRRGVQEASNVEFTVKRRRGSVREVYHFVVLEVTGDCTTDKLINRNGKERKQIKKN